MARRWVTKRQRRLVAGRLTAGVAALHGALLLSFLLDPRDPPRYEGLGQLLWAAARRPGFYLLAVVAVGAPLLTALAWPVRGRHRVWLIISWVVFGAVSVAYYAHRLSVMLRLLWEHS